MVQRLGVVRRLSVMAVLALAACGPADSSALMVLEGQPGEWDGELAVPGQDWPQTVDVACWNLEWFGSETSGPAVEWRQQRNVARVLNQLDVDLVGLVEVVSEDAFATLMTRLPEYEGLLVTAPSVAGGRDWYWSGEQKVALVYKRRFTVESARVVLTEAQRAFGGRPPLEVHLRFEEDGKPRTLVVLVAHFKAMANADGHARRTEAAAALKGYLDGLDPSRWVLVVGDFNDDLDASTYRGSVSPFAPLVEDPKYRFTTDALTAANLSTTTGFRSTIDHHLATRSLARRFVDASAAVVRVDEYVWQYEETTSDHYPVLTRYDLR